MTAAPSADAPTPPVVAVTGAGSGLGRALVERLAARDDLEGLVGLDRTVPRMDGVVWRACDVAGPAAGRAPARHARPSCTSAPTYDTALPAAERRLRNVGGTDLLLTAARAAGCRRVVLTTSADVWGAVPGRPVPLADDCPRSGAPDDTALVGDHVAVEELADRGRARRARRHRAAPRDARRRAARPGVRRPAAAPARRPRGCSPCAGWSRSGSSATSRTCCPRWSSRRSGGSSGPLGVGCEGALPQSRVEVMTGRRRLELPASVALSTAERLHRTGVSASSPARARPPARAGRRRRGRPARRGLAAAAGPTRRRSPRTSRRAAPRGAPRP